MNLENQTDYHEPQSFDRQLSRRFFRYVHHQQSYLDAEFLKVAHRPPSLLDRRNALLDEKGEFYNETKRESRYWALKSNDRQRLLEEYSDMLHFYMGIVIVQVNQELDYLRKAGLLFPAQENIKQEGLLMHQYEKVKRFYTNILNIYFSEEARKGNREVEIDDVISVLSIGRRAQEPHEVLGAATLAMSVFGITDREIEDQYNLVRKNNYLRIERTKQGLPDR